MIQKDINQISEQDLIYLVDNQVLECKTIEYKQSLPGSTDAEKKEFLADVSSFANASGGDLVYGIVEDRDTGMPKSVDGLIIDNVDKEILRLDNIIRNGIERRIPSCTIKNVNLSNSKVALIIRISKSWIAPHGVKSNDKFYKFYSRSSNGKYPLDVGELRIAFNLSETITERIRNFRLDRISKILANETPVTLYDNAKIVLHLIPIASFNPAQSYDISKITSNPSCMPPIYTMGWNHRYNLDGFITYSKYETGKSSSYTQLFRNGIIEGVESLLLEPKNGLQVIPSIAYEQELIKSFTVYLNLLKILNVEPPIFIFLDLLGVKGYSMAVSRRFPLAKRYTIDREVLLLPEVIVESFDVSAEKVLKTAFDSIWNACGFPRDLNYNEAGEWDPES